MHIVSSYHYRVQPGRIQEVIESIGKLFFAYVYMQCVYINQYEILQ